MVKNMKDSWKEYAAAVCTLLGTVSWLYIGAYRLWKGPVMDLIRAQAAGNLTLPLFLSDLFWGFICLTAAGFVWCLWYILRGRFENKK